MSTKIRTEENTDSGNSEKGGQTLELLLEHGLKDIYNAEKQLVAALPEVAGAVDNEELEEAINTHLEQTKKQVARLEKAFEELGIEVSSVEECIVMKSLIEETRKVIQDFDKGPVRDSALIIGSQKIEHYEIASYGSLCELADVLEDEQLGDLLAESLEEEEEADELLSEIAQDVNDEALDMSTQQEEDK